jgi:hypothetical protein
MRVKRIVIVDDRNGEAGEYSFAPGANLLVSADNSQGKSSLLKTLYYGLGLDIKRFPSHWRPSTMSIKLDVFNERTGEELYIVRKGELFYVSDSDEPLNINEYTHWLSSKLDVDLKLTNRTTKQTRSISYPSALITPFYVDQDESWSGRIFSANNEVNMYTETPERIFDYIFNISDDDDQAAKEHISKLSSRMTGLSSKRANINEVYLDYVNKEDESLVLGTSSTNNPDLAASQDIEALTNLIDHANKKYREYKALRIKLQRDLDQKRKSNEEYRDILSMYKKDLAIIKTVCKHCKSELTEEQVKTRMEVTSNIYDLKYLIDVTDKEIADVLRQIDDCATNEDSSYVAYQNLSKEISLAPEFKTITDYIETASTKKSQNEFALIIQELDTEIGKLDSDIKELRKIRRESARAAAALVAKIESRYSAFVNSLSIIMKGSNVNDTSFKEFKAPKSSGVNDNQIYLGIYLTYMRLISEFGRYKLPFCIDSFIKNETSDDKQDVMFAATEKFLLEIKDQSIFSAIESSVERFMNRRDKFNKVQIGERLLSPEKFKDYMAEVSEIVVK